MCQENRSRLNFKLTRCYPVGLRSRFTVLTLLLVASLLGEFLSTSALALDAKAVDNTLVCRAPGQTIKIQPWGRDSLRVRITPGGGGQTSDWALDIAPAEHRAQINLTKDAAEIRNGL